MKYPKKFKKEKTELKLPIFDKKLNAYICCKLLKDGTTVRDCIATYEEESHCWIVCKAHNKRVGYSDKEVKKIIKKLRNVEKEEKRKKGKKSKKKNSKS